MDLRELVKEVLVLLLAAVLCWAALWLAAPAEDPYMGLHCGPSDERIAGC